jgi:hypothetical protein
MIHAPGGYPKKALRPVHRQKFVDFLAGCFQVSVRRAYEVVMANRSTFYYCSRKDDQAFLRKRAAKDKVIRDKIGSIRKMLT